MKRLLLPLLASVLSLATTSTPALAQDLVVRAGKLHTVSGPVIEDGIVVIKDGKITAIGKASEVVLPGGVDIMRCAVATPGLVDAHSVVGLAGWLNTDHDQDQLDRTKSMQPELRAIDAYNARDPLVAWIRSFGVTTVHTGHAPGSIISGQTMVVKTRGNSVEEAQLVERAMVAATIGDSAVGGDGRPGTRSKAARDLRAKLMEARSYLEVRGTDEAKPIDLGLEVLSDVLAKKTRLMVTAHRAQDILTALRIAEEFELELVLDGASEAYLVLEELKAKKVPILLHPTMMRAYQETANSSLETARKLVEAGLSVALQSGYESYVPKTRVVLFEAALAAAYGLGPERALELITLEAAKILGLDKRIGSLDVGKDGDIALYDGDPFESTTHCLGTVIEGVRVSRIRR